MATVRFGVWRVSLSAGVGAGPVRKKGDEAVNRYRHLGLVFVASLAVALAGGCGQDGKPAGNPEPQPIPIVPTAGYLGRQAEYLAFCSEHNGPGEGGTHGQVCRAYTAAGSFNEQTIDRSLAKIDNREDTADFDFNSVMRVLYLDRAHPTLPPALVERIKAAVLGFKYWYEEPGPDTMCWWSENHQVLFHTAELLAGQFFPDEVFRNSGMTGREHAAHALPLLHRWLDFRGRFGFSEWHSNVYFNEDIPPLVNLVDFAGDETIRLKASLALDLIAFDMASNYFQGRFATTHGRTYQDHLGVGGKDGDSTQEAAWILLGLGDYEDTGNFSGAFLATSENYSPPAILEEIAAHAAPALEHRQRDSIMLAEGPAYGIGYEDHRDVLFWWGATGYVAPEVIAGTFQTIEDFNMWNGFIWKDIQFLRFLVGSPLLTSLAEALEPVARGVALETVNTYTWRTPRFQLSGAQDCKPGMWGGQTHMWQATLDDRTQVFTTYPGGLPDDYMGGPWTGGFYPRVTLYRNVGVIQYRRPYAVPLLDDLLFVNYTHAFFPRAQFDEVVQRGNWTLGRKGESYVALWSEHPPAWSPENDYELIADARENVWIVELGDAGASGSFQEFEGRVTGASVAAGDPVVYDSPSLGRVTVGWTGPMTVDGAEVDLGPYNRWDNPYCRQSFGENLTRITHGGRRLELDFETPARGYWSLP